MKLLVPIVLTFAGVGAGVGAGMLLRPDSGAAGEHAPTTGAHGDAHDESAAEPHADTGSHGAEESHSQPAAHDEPAPHGGGSDGHGSAGGGDEYVSLGNQFIVPILDNQRVRSLVVLSIDLEVGPGGSSAIYRVEPKIRDAFLTVLFDHANAGGFSGTFTSSGSMNILRVALREAGQKAVGKDVVGDVLITGIVRQDV